MKKRKRLTILTAFRVKETISIFIIKMETSIASRNASNKNSSRTRNFLILSKEMMRMDLSTTPKTAEFSGLTKLVVSQLPPYSCLTLVL